MSSLERSYTIEVRMAWWWDTYCMVMALLCTVLGTQPDWQKVSRTALRATRVRFVPIKPAKLKA